MHRTRSVPIRAVRCLIRPNTCHVSRHSSQAIEQERAQAQPSVLFETTAETPLDDTHFSSRRRRGARHRRESRAMPHLTPTPSRKESNENRRVDGIISPFDEVKLEDVQRIGRADFIPFLSHGLETVLTNPGVHWLTDPRTGYHNFPEALKDVPEVDDFAFERVRGFVPSSQDIELRTLARRENCMFAGSTSSLTGMLSQIYLLLSNEKHIDLSTLSAPFQMEPRKFTPGQRMPISVSLLYKDGVYATDSDTSHLGKPETILSQLGVVLERFLTMTPRDFQKCFMKSHPPRTTHKVEPFRYAKYGKFMMRAQLDCLSTRLPGTGVFDIKTRAAMPIRYDLANYKNNLDYRITKIQGPATSFEKEYYDLIRSAFLKYSFQARIGNMDGVFVAYHNTREIFGFQYIPIEDMDARLFGHTCGDRIFQKCIGLLDSLFSEIVKHFPEQSVNCTWDTVGGRVLHIWIEPVRGSESEGRVVQLDVKLTHYLGQEKVSGAKAVASAKGLWTVVYAVHQSRLSQKDILKNRQAAFERQLLIYKYSLTPNERVERKSDINLRFLDALRKLAGPPAMAVDSKEDPMMPEDVLPPPPGSSADDEGAQTGDGPSGDSLKSKRKRRSRRINDEPRYSNDSDTAATALNRLSHKDTPVTETEDCDEQIAPNSSPDCKQTSDNIMAQPGAAESSQ